LEKLPFGNKRYMFIVERLVDAGASPSDVIIDCSCGAGTGTLYLQQYFKTVKAFDISQKVVDKCMEKGVKAQVGNVADLPLPDASVDIFVCSETLEHLRERDSHIAAQEILRVCKDGALICITVPENRSFCLGNPNHKQYLSPDDLQNHFKSSKVEFLGQFSKRKGRINTVMVFRK